MSVMCKVHRLTYATYPTIQERLLKQSDSLEQEWLGMNQPLGKPEREHVPLWEINFDTDLWVNVDQWK